MSFNIPSAYELIKRENIDDLQGQGYLLRHKKSGARVAIVENDDNNKVFYIGFRTPPQNSTGVAHILEHSVLCGSKKFPAKDPFIELVKGSLNTFLNAMTYSDKTVYPVASCSEADLKNLMDVYMDAVLYPNIYQREEIFKQEGWHYELSSKEDELKLNGVVYNEMKGVFSSPESTINRHIQSSLFPDTPYGVESGGDPSFIPDLSYEEFLDFHKSYYHPSNSYIYLYGNVDMEDKLIWMDREYLSRFDAITLHSEIKPQTPFKECRECEIKYSLPEGEDSKHNTYLSFNAVIGNSLMKETTLAFDVLTYLLTITPGAPIKKALIDAGIGKDILSSFDDSICQPVFSVIAKNAEIEQKEQFLKVIRDTLAEIVKKGIDEKALRAAINYYEFKYREADYGSYPKGLILGLHMFNSWLYQDDEPFMNLKDNEIYTSLKKKIGTGYFEQLIQKYLLDNTHTSMVMSRPEAGLLAKEEDNLNRKLQDYKNSLSDEEIEKIIVNTKALKEYQETPSTREEILSIPLLSREDIGKDAEPIYNEEKQIEGTKVIHHNIFTNGIAYIRVFFHLQDIKQEDIPYLSLLSTMLGYVDTNLHSYFELSNEINIHTGGMATDVKGFSVMGTTHRFTPVIELSTKVLYKELATAFSLAKEIMFETKISDTKRMLEIIDELISRMQMRFNSSGHVVAIERATSYYSEHALFKEDVSGIGLFEALKTMRDGFDAQKDEIVQKMQTLLASIFQKSKMFVSLTADEEGYRLFEENFKDFLASLPEGNKGKEEQMELTPTIKNEGFKTAMQVQYNAVVGNFYDAGYSYTGALKVLKTILGNDFLWNQVRVMGGAYGCMCGFSWIDGDMYLVSYRDPKLKETYGVYEQVSDFVANFEADEREITKYIIGTMSNVDTPLTPYQKGKRSFMYYMAGVSFDDIKKDREEILSVTVEKIRALSGLVRAVTEKNYICTLGNENKVEEDKELFRTISTLS